GRPAPGGGSSSCPPPTAVGGRSRPPRHEPPRRQRSSPRRGLGGAKPLGKGFAARAAAAVGNATRERSVPAATARTVAPPRAWYPGEPPRRAALGRAGHGTP